MIINYQSEHQRMHNTLPTFTGSAYETCKVNRKTAGSKQWNQKNQVENHLSSIHTISEDKATCSTLKL